MRGENDRKKESRKDQHEMLTSRRCPATLTDTFSLNSFSSHPLNFVPFPHTFLLSISQPSYTFQRGNIVRIML